MAQLKYRKSSTTYTCEIYDSIGGAWETAAMVRVGGATKYVPLTSSLGDAKATDLRIRKGGTTYAFMSSEPTLSRGVFGGGYGGSGGVNTIQYVTIENTGNATDFGDLTVARYGSGAVSNSSNDRGVFGSGSTNVLDYVAISSAGNATDFGDPNGTYNYSTGVNSNGTNERGLWGGSSSGANRYNNIQYVTINSAGNATDFGNLTYSAHLVGGNSNGTNERGLFFGGSNTGTNIICYVTINSTGNAIDFGDMSYYYKGMAGCSNLTNERGIMGGGMYSSSTYYNVIDYVTINSTGNSSDFGDLTAAKYEVHATSNGTNERGVFAGGYNGTSPYYQDVIEYITINSTGNATDFGDLNEGLEYPMACSNAA